VYQETGASAGEFKFRDYLKARGSDLIQEVVYVSGRDTDVFRGDADLGIGARPLSLDEDLPPLSSLTRTPPSNLPSHLTSAHSLWVLLLDAAVQ
jgi:hypothetical protein